MATGVIAVWGPVDDVVPPRLLLPLTVEPLNSQNINVLEAQALLNSLRSFSHHIGSCRVDVHTDSLVLKSALVKDGCRDSDVNGIIKDIFDCCREFNFSLDVHYVPSSKNPADFPSRSVSDAGCMLSRSAWEQVEHLFGPQTFDLMSLDSNCQRDRKGQCLPHFTPCATSASSGINVFAQSLPLDYNLYVFPPFVLIPPLLKYLLEQDFHGPFTIITPDLKPRRFWWALLQSIAVDRTLLGRKGESQMGSTMAFQKFAVGFVGFPLHLVNSCGLYF